MKKTTTKKTNRKDNPKDNESSGLRKHQKRLHPTKDTRKDTLGRTPSSFENKKKTNKTNETQNRQKRTYRIQNKRTKQINK